MTATLKDDSGVGLSGRKVLLSANNGSFSGFSDLGNGNYRGTLKVNPSPPPRLPGYVLILVSADLDGRRAPVAGETVKIISNLVIKGKTAPGVQLVGVVDGKDAGEKITAGEDGSYVLTIPIPPEANSIEISASVPSRTPGAKPSVKVAPVDLDIKKHEWLVVQAIPEKVDPASDTPVFVNVFAVSEQGTEYTRGGVSVNCNPGRCGSPESRGGGLYQAQFEPDPQTTKETVRISASAGGHSATGGFELIPSGVKEVKIAVKDSGTIFKPGDIVHLEIQTVDHAGNPVTGPGPEVFVDGESIGRAVETEPGKYLIEHTLTVESAGSHLELMAVAEGMGSGGATIDSEELTVQVEDVIVELTASSESDAVSPGEKINIEIKATDVSRTGIEGITLQVSATSGSTDAVKELGDGKYSFDFTAPPDYDGTEIPIEITAPDLPGGPATVFNINWAPAVEEEIASDSEAGTLSISSSREEAEPGDTVLFTATLTDEDGKALEGQTVTYSSNAGSGNMSDSGNGLYAFELDVTKSLDTGNFSVTAACDCDGKNLSAQASVEIKPLTPTAIELELSDTEIFIKETTEIDASVIVTDKNGDGLENVVVRFNLNDISSSSTTEATTDSSGAAAVSFSIGNDIGQAGVTAEVTDGASLSATENFEKKKRPISRLELEASAVTIPANGVNTLDVEVHAIDEIGNDSFDERIDFSVVSGSGRVNAAYATTGDDGRCTVFYTAGLACGNVQIQAVAYSDTTVKKMIQFEETPAVPNTVNLDSTLSHLIADNVDTLDITVQVLDAGGCPVKNVAMLGSVASGSGTIDSTATTDVDGKATFTFKSSFIPGTETLLFKPQNWQMVMLSVDVTVDPWEVAKYRVEPASLSQTAGQQFNVTITGLDDINRTVTTFDATVENFTLSGPGDSYNGNTPDYPTNTTIRAAFSNGVATIPVTLYKAETVKLKFEDAGGSQGQSNNITVSPTTQIGFKVVPPSSVTAGSSFTLTIFACDTYGNVVTSYNESGKSYNFTGPSAAPDGSAPSYPSNPSIRGDFHNGSASISVKLYKMESTTISVNDGTYSGTSNTVSVTSTTTRFKVSPAGTTQTTGAAFNVTITAWDAYENVITSYDPTGKTYTFTGPSSAPNSTAPSYPTSTTVRSAFSSGVATVSVTLYKVESVALTVSDGSTNGTSSNINVTGGANRFTVVASPSSQTAGTAISVTITAMDAYDNVVTNYNSAFKTYTFTNPSNAPDGTGPSYPSSFQVSTNFSSGVCTRNVTLYAAETTTIKVSDGSINGTSNSITISPGPINNFGIVPASTSQTAGTAFSVTMTARDQWNNPNTTYNSSGKSYAFSGPGDSPAPVSQSPAYPSSGSLVSGFSAGVVTYNVTLYKAETVQLGVNDGAGTSGNSANITVASAAADKIAKVSGDTQTRSVTKATADPIVVSVIDVYANPVPNHTVLFSVTGGGGNVNGGPTQSTTTNSSGQAQTSTWYMGPTAAGNPNTLDAAIAAGTVTSVSFSATAVDPPTAVINLVAPAGVTSKTCAGTSFQFNGVGSAFSAGASSLSYSWDFDSDSSADATVQSPAAHTYYSAGTFDVTLTVTDDVGGTKTATYTPSIKVYNNDVDGTITLTPTLSTIAADGASQTEITSPAVLNCDGAAATGTFTVSTSLGSIVLTPDADGVTDGLQVAPGPGLSFWLRSGTTPGVATVYLKSLTGKLWYSGQTTVTFTGADAVKPFVTSQSPSGVTTGTFSNIRAWFSEDVVEALVENPFNFRVEMATNSTNLDSIYNNCSRTYSSSEKRLTYTCDEFPLDAADVSLKVTIKSGVTDAAGNGLDGNQTNDDYVFKLGGSAHITCTAPVVASCSRNNATISPDTNGPAPHDSTISYQFTDNHHLVNWVIRIKDSSGDIVRTYNEYSVGCIGCDTGSCAAGCTTDTGVQNWIWDGRNQSGQIADNGAYTIEVLSYDLSSCTPTASTDCGGQTITINNPIDFGNFGP